MPSRITVIGCGYVGLTTGACFAHLGHDVTCTDVDELRVDMLNRGEVPILEAGLENMVREGMNGRRLSFVVGSTEAAAESEFIYLCVPTPQGADGSADLSFIESVAAEISPHLEPDTVVVNKSTVPVGSTRVVEQVLGRSDVSVVSNPEFLREGSAVHDFLHPDRIVIGADDQAAAVRVASLYLGIAAPLIVTDPASAELIKYASNAFLATKVSFVNAVAAVCEAVGADMNDVVLGMGYDKRIGQEFLRPGPGWGGSCFVGDETVLVRRDGRIRLLSFGQLWNEVQEVGTAGWEVLSWSPGTVTPEFEKIERFTARPYDGDVIDVKTKMGRRLTVTADHDYVVGTGSFGGVLQRKLARDLTTEDWLPVAVGAPLSVEFEQFGRVLDALEPAGISPRAVTVVLDELQYKLLRERGHLLTSARRKQVYASRTLRLDELERLEIPLLRGRVGTAASRNRLRATIEFDESHWYVVGLFLAEGCIRAGELIWSFHKTDEADLVASVSDYLTALGVSSRVEDAQTTCQIRANCRLLAAYFEHVLGTGHSAYDHRIPDQIWAAPEGHKRALLRGLWDGDGSWSHVNRGPSVVLEYGTVSRALADGMVRLLSDLGVVARLKVGRTKKSTVDTYWLCISGAAQIEEALWLFGDDERSTIRDSINAQVKRIAPTGYRRLGDKNAVWVRIASVLRRHFSGTVYSVEVPGPHTVVTSFALVCGNCFPKDSRALIRIAEDAGYDFELLEGVVDVNEAQFERVARKAIELAGGSLDGKVVAVWGLTFKARTDDLRESPSLEIVRRLLEQGAKVRAFDPSVTLPLDDRRASVLEGIEVTLDPYAACTGAEVLVVLTEWDEFRWLDFDKVASAMSRLCVVDGRNLLDREALRRRGFAYKGIGRLG